MAEYAKCPEHYVFGLDIGTRSIVGTVGYREDEKNFRVVAQVVKMHETRAMLDGQIHDIAKVAETISIVKKQLEEKLQYQLKDVSIAAAGRVLKTVTVRADYELDDECVIDDEHIHTLELMGMEQAYEEIRKDGEQEIGMYCVGSTVIHYYLDDFIMLNLDGHKGRKISADFLATFLPNEVIESLYAAVEKAGLSVANLTLEPIAASEVAIPVNFRLLNIALVDVGAGTSDISITKDGSIIGYGMIPTAGDNFTEEIAKRYLVDFAGAEEIKMACFSGKVVKFKDIMGIAHKIEASEILAGLQDSIERTTKLVADKIIELNGDNAVSAVFIVGGGGKLPNFAESLAKHLDIPEERVAVRGKEVFYNVQFDEPVKLDSTLVTPIGICLTHLSKNTSFLMVSVNGNQIKLYDNNKLTVMDAAIHVGFPKDNLFPKRGKSINFTINNEARMVRGEAGEGAKITINGKVSSFNTKIVADDIIEILPSTEGADATTTIGALPEFKRKGEIQITVNGKNIVCPRMVKVNGEPAVETQNIVEGDKIEILDYYMIGDVLELMDMPYPKYFNINDKEGDWEDRIYDGFSIDCQWDSLDNKEAEETTVVTSQDKASMMLDAIEEENLVVENNTQVETIEEEEPKIVHDITVEINDMTVTLKNKTGYIFVDVLDVYPFDTHVAGGTLLVQKVNGMMANFSTKIKDGDHLELYWKD